MAEGRSNHVLCADHNTYARLYFLSVSGNEMKDGCGDCEGYIKRKKRGPKQ